MKNFLLFATLVAFIAFTSNAQITNGGFETWTAAMPDGWGGLKTHTSGLTVHKVTATDSVHGGTNACGLKNTYTAHRRFTTVATSITNGTSYELSFWVLGKVTDSIRTSMFTGCILCTTYGYLDYGSYIKLTGGWTQITRTLVADTTTSAAEFIIDAGIGSDIVIDDVTVTAGTGISEISQSDLSIYPNPASNVLYINSIKNIDMIQISNILGENISTIKVNNSNTSIDISNLSDGMYFLTLFDTNGIAVTKKFSKE